VSPSMSKLSSAVRAGPPPATTIRTCAAVSKPIAQTGHQDGSVSDRTHLMPDGYQAKVLANPMGDAAISQCRWIRV
jgi:hypothetical protein